MSTNIARIEGRDWRIENATIVSPGDELRRGYAIESRGGVISAIVPMTELASPSPATTLPPLTRAQVIDARGAICMPGFVNTHNHTPLTIVRGMVEDIGFAPAYTPGIPQGDALSDDEIFAMSRLGMLELLLAGCTTVVDYYRAPHALARAAIEIGSRAFIGGRIMDVSAAALAQGRFETDSKLGDRLLGESMDMISSFDGAEQGRIQAIHAPHASDTCSPRLLREIAALSEADGRQVHTHLAQSELELRRIQERDACHPVELLNDVGLLNQRLFAAHCIFLDQTHCAALGRAGSTLCHAPLGNAAFGALAPVHALDEAGARITLCTDTKSADMFETMRMALAAARIRSRGQFVYSADTVLAWATCDGAAALGMDDVGRVRVGYQADLLLLEPDAANLCPVVDGTGVVVHSGVSANVDHVFVGGNHLVANRQILRGSAGEITQTAQEVADRLWAKARCQ